MAPYTKFLTKDAFQKKLISAANEFADTAFSEYVDTIDLLPINISDGAQLINFIAAKHSWPDIIRKTFLLVFYKSENNCKSSGIFAAYFFSRFIIERKAFNTDHLRYSGRVCASYEVFDSADRLLEENTVNFMKSVIKEIGTFGNLSIQETIKTTPTIEISGGHKFECGLHEMFPEKKVKLSEARILLVDGAIQEVSEIDFILQELNRTMEPFVIVARAFSNDVANTLAANYKRNTLNVFPVKVDDKISAINIFGDLATCSGTVLISRESGVRLNAILPDECALIRNVSFTKSQLDFDSKPEQSRHVGEKIKKIKRKSKDAALVDGMSAEDLNIVFSSRIKSLSSNSVTLWAPGGKNNVQYLRKNFNFYVNYLAAFANTGKINTSDILEDDENLPEQIPAIVAEFAINSANAIYSSISTVGGCIEISAIDKRA